ncbi:preprotein translocase subunit SecY [Erysipelothrix larvae]|uniref:Protein translocase subunit SecY n=1 Tax=Erysipelothrix larvae TaxID=1514105 RepID=A0A109UH39_9FIRM|nr:preprotein translocase subunit SecY [Erysipelothrix larvae]AMC93571.1 preprotein translocase subunit SecY [Erysipelothrix larvae]
MIRFITDLFKNKEIRNRIIFTLTMLAVFRLGTVMTVPNVDRVKLQAGLGSNSILDMMSLLGGGALQTFSIFSMGVGPYINASIIVQLLSMDIIPYLAELAKSGQKGKMQMDRITRYLAIVLAFVQSITLLIAYQNQYGILMDTSAQSYLFMATVMSAGTMFLLWLGDQITTKGVGNGMSLIIFAGIVAHMPTNYANAFTSMVTDNNYSASGIAYFALFVLLNLTIIVLVVFMNQAVRKITIQYSSSSGATRGKNMNHLPLKINSANVIPVIFASAILQAPLVIMSWINQDFWLYKFMNQYLALSTPGGLIAYIVLIIFFTFFYTHLTVDPEKIAENFGKNNSYIPGVRPGKDTKRYITTVLNRITVFGAIFIAFIALLPYLLPIITNGAIPHATAPGGTGIIIVVGVALETVKELQGRLAQRTYSGFFKH